MKFAELLEQAKLSPSARMLVALSRSGKPIYPGTVDPSVKARRRAANKRARVSRRVNRGRS